jgi:hypothetical protein
MWNYIKIKKGACVMKFVLTTERYYDDLDEDEYFKFPYSKFVTFVNGYLISKRTTDDPRKIPYYISKPDEAMDWWFNNGIKHRIIDGWITRDEPIEFYLIEFINFIDFQEFLDELKTDIAISNVKRYIFEGEELGVLTIKDGY